MALVFLKSLPQISCLKEAVVVAHAQTKLLFLSWKRYPLPAVTFPVISPQMHAGRGGPPEPPLPRPEPQANLRHFSWDQILNLSPCAASFRGLHDPESLCGSAVTLNSTVIHGFKTSDFLCECRRWWWGRWWFRRTRPTTETSQCIHPRP